jgi:hypothetical protein
MKKKIQQAKPLPLSKNYVDHLHHRSKQNYLEQ